MENEEGFKFITWLSDNSDNPLVFITYGIVGMVITIGDGGDIMSVIIAAILYSIVLTLITAVPLALLSGFPKYQQIIIICGLIITIIGYIGTL